MTKIITFYSYKGGVGRTMALVNTAQVLAARGLRILMVDLDLEAPGMTHFFSTHVRKQSRHEMKDALDLLLEVKAGRRREAGSFAEVSLSKYVVPIALDSSSVGRRSPYLQGRLDLLPAALDVDPTLAPSRSYLERLNELDLPGIFGPHGPGHNFGNDVRSYFERVRFGAPGDLRFTLRDPVSASYDLILVDSRTGLNESSGLCVGPLCDAIVVCTGLNEQNVAGTQYFMQQAGLFDKEKSKPYTVVVGPIPPWSKEEESRRLERIETALKISEVGARVPYHPAAALGEPLFVLTDEKEPIGAAYAALASVALRLAGSGDAAKPHLGQNTREGWRTYQREWAALLAPMRHRPDENAWLNPAPFPTACAHAGIRRDSDWAPTGALDAVGAAVAALQLRSDLPFEQALATEKRHRDDELSGHLLFMRLRIADRLPIKKQAWVTKLLSREPGSMSHMVAHAYASALGVSRRRGPLKKDSFHLGYFLRDLDEYFDPEISRLFPDVLQEKLAPRVRARLRSRFRDSESYLANLGKDPRRATPPYSLRQTPPGLWTIPLMVSMVSLIKGAPAADEILRWLDLCRKVYGYAWRVLVDWRHLKPLEGHPGLVAFIADEDERVAEIEGQIDSGEFPL